MKIETPWWAKIIIGLISIFLSIVAGWEYIKMVNKTEVLSSEVRIMETVRGWRAEGRNEIRSGDSLNAAKIAGVDEKVTMIDKNVRLILKNQLKQLSDLEEDKDGVYTRLNNPMEGKNI